MTLIVFSACGHSSGARHSRSEMVTSKPRLNPTSGWPTRHSEQPTAKTLWSITARPESSWRSKPRLEYESGRRIDRRRSDLERDHLVGGQHDLAGVAGVKLRALLVGVVDVDD